MEQRLLCFLAGKAKELRAYTTIVLDQQGSHGATCGPTVVSGLLVHRHRAEPVRGSTELLTSLRHLPSCWTSVRFYGTTYASGFFPPISIVSSFFFYFPSHFEGAFLCFPGSEVRPWPCATAKPPAQNLISLGYLVVSEIKNWEFFSMPSAFWRPQLAARG